jgi:NAD dependent epimerase/dehydratase
MELTGTRVLVTGAGGFIGSHLVERLVRLGAQVRALVHYNGRNDWGNLELGEPQLMKEVEVVLGDVRDPFGVDRAIADREVVFHLAALIGIPYSYHSPQSYVATNVQGTLNVLEACRRHEIKKLVHTSTSESYGTALYEPIDEQHALQPQSPYSASKIGADQLAQSYFLSFGLPVATIRPFNTYGPRQSARAVIPTIITQVLAGAREIRLGALDPVRDLTFVTDTVEGFVRMAQCDASVGQVLNVGNGCGISVGDLARTILDLMNAPATLACDADRVRPERSEVRKLICDHRRFAALTGWQPTVTLEEGLRATASYLTANFARYKAGRYVV